MEGRSAVPWEQERCVPVRACGAKDSGGAAGPSTIKGKRLLLRCLNKCNVFPSYRMLGWAMCQKAHRLALAEAPSLFSLSYCVGKTINSVNVCLQCPVFNASGAAVCPPQCLARRWVERRTEKRVAWPWWRRRFLFSLSYSVGKTLKSVNVCLECPVFNTSGAAVCRPRCLAGR